MATTEDIIQGFRDWIKAYGSTSALDDSYVRPAASEGPKTTTHPYLVVEILTPGRQVGEDERNPALDGSLDPTKVQRGLREAVVNVQCIGSDSWSILESAMMVLELEEAKVIFDAKGITVPEPLGDPTNVKQLLDTAIEERWSQDFTVRYMLTSAPFERTELETVQANFTQDPGATERTWTADIDV